MRTKNEIPQKEVVTIRLKQKTARKVDEICKNKEETRSEFIRRIVENYIENY